MRRLLMVLASTTLVLGSGCSRSYEQRLERTIELMKYHKRLDANLLPAVTKDKLETSQIYLRPPRSLAKLSEFSLGVPEVGRFDVTESFVENQTSLHVVARVRKVKDPKKKAETTDAATRGEFQGDVFALLGSVGVDVEVVKTKDQSKGKVNKFRFWTAEAEGNVYQVYFYGTKTAPPEVALIFKYPKSESQTLAPKIDLCLESFATGTAAASLFNGGEAGAEPGEGAAPPGASAAM